MVESVMEDILKPRRGIVGRRVRNTALACMSCLVWTVIATPALGQDIQSHAFRVKVLDLSSNHQKVTVPLYRNVTIETTLEVTRADVVAALIADIQVINPRRIMITGQSYGTTTLTLTGVNNEQFMIEISVELDLELLNTTLGNIDSLSEVEAVSVMGNIVLTGRVSSLDRAQRMVELAELFLPRSASRNAEFAVQNHMTIVGEQQVTLKCIVAEVSRAATRELGVNGFIAGKQAADAFFINQLGGINPINIGAARRTPISTGNGSVFPLADAFITGENGIPVSPATTLSIGFPKIQAQTFIRAMTDNNLLKVLAEPSLTAISGEEATFLAGGEFPIPVPQGNQQVTIDFREFGVRLNFTPTVLGHQRIRLHVAPEVSELDFSAAVQIEGFVVPGLSTRAAETTVEVGNGQTITIAGLLSEQIRGISSRVPGMGDLPILGTLFRSVNFQRSLTELVILVTPEIVAPLEPHQKIRLPGEDILSPSDKELYFMGLLEARNENQKPKDDPLTMDVSSDPDELSLHGPWGHAGSNSGK